MTRGTGTATSSRDDRSSSARPASNRPNKCDPGTTRRGTVFGRTLIRMHPNGHQLLEHGYRQLNIHLPLRLRPSGARVTVHSPFTPPALGPAALAPNESGLY